MKEMPEKYKNEVLFRKIIKESEYRAVRAFFEQKLHQEERQRTR
jgi:hypothetical protein